MLMVTGGPAAREVVVRTPRQHSRLPTPGYCLVWSLLPCDWFRAYYLPKITDEAARQAELCGNEKKKRTSLSLMIRERETDSLVIGGSNYYYRIFSVSLCTIIIIVTIYRDRVSTSQLTSTRVSKWQNGAMKWL